MSHFKTRSRSEASTLFSFQKSRDERAGRQLQKEKWLIASRLRGDTAILEQLGLEDLTQSAYENRLPLGVGMNREVESVFKVLQLMKANTALLYGANGVGKSTLPLVLARRIVSGRVPPWMNKCRVLQLSLSCLSAGAGFRGEMGQRFKAYFTFLGHNPHIITVIDEVQLLMSRDFPDAEIVYDLKYHLGKGKHRFIFITDHVHYPLVTKDPAIKGRITPVQVSVPEEKDVLRLFRHFIGRQLSSHHDVGITPELITDAYRLSQDCVLYDREQPARTITLIDMAMSEESFRNWKNRNSAQNRPSLQRETLMSTARMFSGSDTRTLTHPERLEILNALPEELKKRIVGQDEIIEAISMALKRRYKGLMEEQTDMTDIRDVKRNNNMAYFLYGDTATGKTSMARMIGERLTDKVIVVDCSRLTADHKFDTYEGAPPGYIFSDVPSKLSIVRSYPFMCWIFDEFEKANSRRLENCLLQILDWPHRYTDNTGMDLDFSRCIFFFTSNVGHSRLEKRRIGFQGEDTLHHRRSDIHLLTKYFKEEFIGRFGENIFHFNPLNGNDYSQIIDLELRQYEQENRIQLTMSDKARGYFIASAEERGTGARGLINKMAKDLDEAGLESMVNDSSIRKKVFHIIRTKNNIKIIHKGKHQRRGAHHVEAKTKTTA